MPQAAKPKHVYVVDDDAAIVNWLREALGEEGYAVSGSTSPVEALAYIAEHQVDVLISDVEMPGLRGIDLLRAVLDRRSDQLVILITAFGTIDLAVSAVRAGAADFLAKPFQVEALSLAIERALRERHLRHEIVRLRHSLTIDATGDVVARSPGMRRALELAARAAESDVPVLITGESGSGKGVVARFLHQRSPRRAKPFVQLNCSALPATLVESELFGVRRGAFTDARADRAGVFLEADGGTLLLDEIGEMSLEVQPKLLRAIETRMIRPVGASAEVLVDVRFVAATNRLIEEDVRDKRFRADLFHRIDVIRIEIPPLRERPEDIEPLVDRLLYHSTRRFGREIVGIADEALRWLEQRPWPGNVRELSNAVERAVALAEHDVLLSSDFERGTSASSPADLFERALVEDWSLGELENAYIRAVLEKTRGNKAQAARILGLDRRTLYRKAASLGAPLDEE
jgi:DNA-binding NtrC family response regulator